MDDLIKTVKEAWNVNELDIEDNVIKIKTNFEITKNYLDYVITFR
jgi:hypothetical protein